MEILRADEASLLTSETDASSSPFEVRPATKRNVERPSIFDSVPIDAPFTWQGPHPATRTKFNKAAERYFGLRASELDGEIWFEAIHVEDQTRYREQMEEAARIGQGYAIEYRLRHSSGTYHLVLEQACVYTEGDTRVFLGSCIDLEQRRLHEADLREDEERLRAILDSVPVLISYVDRDHIYRFNNYTYENWMQRRLSEIECRHMRDVLGQAAYKERLPYIEMALNGSSVVFNMSTPDERGEIRDTLVAYVPDLGKDEVRGFFAVVQDISDLKKAHRNLAASEALVRQTLARERVAREEAERVSRAKDEFLATLSHELRTPLNSILGWTQYLRRSMTAGVEAEGLSIIEKNGRAQAKLIEDLLDMGRIISGKIRLEAKPIDFAQVVRDAVQTIQTAASAKQITINVDTQIKNCRIVADKDRLQQVIWNLLSNSLKFTPTNGTIVVSLDCDENDFVFSVRDSGIGIEAEFLPFVFDRFRQADGATTRKFGGLGLGLSIVKQLVELHGGTISVASEGENRGTTFTVRLPKTLAGRGADPMLSDAIEEQTRPILQNKKILIVDDEDDWRRLLCARFEELGATVYSYGSVDEALHALLTAKFDVIVSDIAMPDKDGFSLLDAVRSEFGDIPVIAVSALASIEQRKRAKEEGFVRYITKPVSPDEVANMVQELLG